MAMHRSTSYLNNQYTEINIERTKTTTLHTRDAYIKTEELFTYLSNLDLIKAIDCIQRLSIKETQFHEVTFKDEEARVLAECQLQAQRLIIDGKQLELIETRTMKDLVKNPIIKVLIFEAPYELPDRHVIQKMKTYGELSEPMVYHHTYRGSTIYNDVRSVNYRKIVAPIPTSTFVRGNRIQFKHEGQDRAPICGHCCQKGHFRDECPLRRDIDAPEKQPEQMSKSWSDIVKGQKELLKEKQMSKPVLQEKRKSKQIIEEQTVPKQIDDRQLMQEDIDGFQVKLGRRERQKRKIGQIEVNAENVATSMKPDTDNEEQEENIDVEETTEENERQENEEIEEFDSDEKERQEEEIEELESQDESEISDMDEDKTDKTSDQSYYSGSRVDNDFQNGQKVKSQNEGLTDSQIEKAETTGEQQLEAVMTESEVADAQRWDSQVDSSWNAGWTN